MNIFYLLVLLTQHPDGAVSAQIIDEGLTATDCYSIAARIPVLPGYALVCEVE